MEPAVAVLLKASAASRSPMAMMGVPTGTVLPSSTISAVTTPANGLGSSTIDFAVSMSTRMSLTWTVSPTATRQVTISASVRPSPTSGSLYSLMQVPLERAGGVDGIEDTVDARQEVILDPAGRVRHVVPGDALHGCLQ